MSSIEVFQPQRSWAILTISRVEAGSKMVLIGSVLIAALLSGACGDSAGDTVDSPQECIDRGGQPVSIDVPDDGQGPVGACKGAGY